MFKTKHINKTYWDIILKTLYLKTHFKVLKLKHIKKTHADIIFINTVFKIKHILKQYLLFEIKHIEN